MNYNDALNLLKKYNQEHILKFYDELNDEEKMSILSTIESIDFDLINALYSNTATQNKSTNVSIAKSFKKSDVDDRKKYIKLGAELIKNRKTCYMFNGWWTRN